ncbi:MAG: DUF805 domain-containing protein [Rhizobiaceae bacterium]|jgi:uncharacterized membrane protein YhaH (DUF805 family)|nr:MAG: DUF805 domain-containing protein [Rhizobiaceae bacterium]
MDFATAVKTVVMQKYANFSGRAIRSEYWWFVLAYIIAYLVLAIVDYVLGAQLLTAILSLALLIPSIAVGVRRLHDLDKSGWWLLLGLVPIVGLILIYWFAQPGTPGDNRFGPPAI